MHPNESLLLFGRELNHARFAVGMNRRENLSIRTKVGVPHVFRFDDTFQSERNPPEVRSIHLPRVHFS